MNKWHSRQDFAIGISGRLVVCFFPIFRTNPNPLVHRHPLLEDIQKNIFNSSKEELKIPLLYHSEIRPGSAIPELEMHFSVIILVLLRAARLTENDTFLTHILLMFSELIYTSVWVSIPSL